MSKIVDFHSHILPQIDDGSRSVEMSVAMLQAEASQGIGTVVLTPHFYANHDSPDAFLSRRKKAEELLREALKQNVELPDIVMGAEVAYFRGMSESDALRKLCIGDTKYILIELPAPPWKERVYAELQDIVQKQGLTPIIAHVDRYLPMFRVNRVMDRLETLPVMIQANAHFFTGRRTAGTALRLLQEGRIHLLGSDCHNLNGRAPDLGAAIERIRQRLGEAFLDRIIQNEQKILVNWGCTN